MRNRFSLVAVMLLLLLGAGACVKGEPTLGGVVVNDRVASEAFTQLKQIDLGLNVAIDAMWSMRVVNLITSEEYAKFDALAVKTNTAVRTARDAVLKYLEYKSLGVQPSGFQSYLTMAAQAYEDVKILKAFYESGGRS